MEKFLALPEEKQRAILDAAMEVFGAVGYKKAFVSDIAAKAGISKAMVFYYFGSKRDMYLYLSEVAFREMAEALTPSPEVSDFFDRVLLGTRRKLAVLEKHPALIRFLTSAYLEPEAEVAAAKQSFFSKGDAYRSDFVLTSVDTAKFKDSVDPQLVLNLLVKYAEGCVNGPLDLSAVMEEFTACVAMLRQNFYKEEYLA